ncbi:MAG TPA: hypothetical protein VHJ39_20335 [Solirubrobacteraceae bacterium]|jgi:hypothetical protein|nr:hypothetical protein [Solirubrobacteraceae bacterium]
MRAPLLAAATLMAALLPAAPAAAGDPIMRLSEVRSGMQCTGFSVIRGTTISSFSVEVVDVVDSDPGTGTAMILVEVSGPAVDRTGVGPGFSGSPIYCNGRNIGAISQSIGDYGGKVVLATPIESMLANPVDAPRARPRAARAAAAPSPRATAALRRIRREGTRPLLAPLTISGVHPALGRALERAGRRIGRPVTAVPAGPLGSFPKQTLRPGSAVAASLSTGDVKVSGLGTVTYTDADRVWAFGHPFENAGARSLFLQDAYIFKVIYDPLAPITGGSFKLGFPGHDLGTLTNDASSAIVGRVGALPKTTAVQAFARDADTGATRLVQSSVADETDLDNPTGFTGLGAVAPLAVAQAAGTVMQSAPGRLTGRMCVTIRLRERPRRPARFCNRYLSSAIFDPMAGALSNPIAFPAAFDVSDAVALIESYEGRTPHVASLRARVDLQRGERLAFLRGVKAPRRVRGGQRVTLRVKLQRLRGGVFTTRYRVRIPRVKPGRRALRLSGFEESFGGDELLEILLGAEPEEEPDVGPARLRDLLDEIEGLGRWDGVELRIGGKRRHAFLDRDRVITGSARTTVRVVR